MAKKARAVRHLQERDGRFYARLAVPVELRPIIGKRELLKPLGPIRARAIANLHAAVARFQAVLDEARGGIAPDPQPVAVRRAVRDHYAAELKLDDATAGPGRFVSRQFNARAADPFIANLQRVASMPAQDDAWRDHDAPPRRAAIASQLDRLRQLGMEEATGQGDEPGDLRTRTRESLVSSIELLRRELEARDSFVEATVGHAITAACQAQGVPRPAPGSPAYRALAQALAGAQLEALQRTKERDAGNFDGKPFFDLLRERGDQPEELPPVSIEGLLDVYLTMRARSGVGEAARRRWTPVFARLVAFLGHDDARKVTKADLQRWLEHLRARGLSERTIHDVELASVKTVLAYAVELDTLPANPAQSIKVRLGRREQRRDPGFDRAEAEAIIAASRSYELKPSSNPATREGEHLIAAKRWLPILCAHTGARITEMAQLRREDVRERDGLHYARITPDAGSVKTGQFRDVPLHPQLVELGFLDFAKSSPSGPLFYKLDPHRKGTTNPAQAVSGRISQWLQGAGLIPEGLQPNHAWRHRLKTIGREVGIDGRVLDAIQGHAARTAGDNYGDVTLKAKAAALGRFPAISVAATKR